MCRYYFNFIIYKNLLILQDTWVSVRIITLVRPADHISRVADLRNGLLCNRLFHQLYVKKPKRLVKSPLERNPVGFCVWEESFSVRFC